MEVALPGWLGAERLVRYFDPLRSAGRILSTFHKEFRFAYQREYRFVWDPPVPTLSLDPVEVSLGSIEDVASLVKL
jgi:hypothetical protein